MMNGFTRYVFWQLLAGMVLVTVGLTFIIWLSQSLRFVEMIVNQGLGAGKFIYMIMLLLPNFLSIILPIALFTVVVFIYSKLISDSELVVMRAAGVNQIALASPAVVLALFVVVFGYALNMYLVPHSYRMFREMQWDIRYSYSHVLLQEGTFNNVSSDVTVYVRKRTGDGQLLGIMVHDRRDIEKPYTLLAERGAFIESDNLARVVMFKGSRQEVDSKTHQISILYFDRYIFDIASPSKEGISRYREARERSLSELLNPERDKQLDRKDYGKFRVEAHKRLAYPLSALGYTLIGLACLLSGNSPRRSQASRSGLAIFIVVAIQIMLLGLENISARDIRMIPLIYIGVITPVIVSYLFILHIPKRRAMIIETGNQAGNQAGNQG